MNTENKNETDLIITQTLIRKLMLNISNADDTAHGAEVQALKGDILGALGHLVGTRQRLLDALALLDTISIINKSE